MATTTAPTNGRRMSGTNDAVARSWVDGYAGGKANNMSNVVGTLYSYTTPIGRRVLAADGKTVFYVLSDRSFSMTTKTKHLAPARNAVARSGGPLFQVWDVTCDDDAGHRSNRATLLTIACELAGKMRKARTNREFYARAVLREVRAALFYSALAGLTDFPDPETPALILADWLQEYADAPDLAAGLREAYTLTTQAVAV
jgi:hypothetical protein